MKNIKEWLQKYSKKTITLTKLEEVCSGYDSYHLFWIYIISLVDEGVLSPVKASGSNGKGEPLYNKYRINKELLKIEGRKLINEKILTVSPLLSLESYFGLPLEVFKKDLKFIDQVDTYVKNKGLPKGKFLPELAFELTGNEKWIEKGDGKAVLTRLGVWQALEVQQKPDPLSFGINRNYINEKLHRHLIIENKTPFIHVMDCIESSVYSTVIYGQGWKITGGMEMFFSQFPFGEVHEFYYFGDIDKAGIAIYSNLEEHYGVYPAKNFYKAMFERKQYDGKTGQHCDDKVIKRFIDVLKTNDCDSKVEYIGKMLADSKYQPQELLSKDDIQRILANEVSKEMEK